MSDVDVIKAFRAARDELAAAKERRLKAQGEVNEAEARLDDAQRAVNAMLETPTEDA